MVSLNCNLLNLATKSVLKSLVPPLAATVTRVGNLETLGFQSNLVFLVKSLGFVGANHFYLNLFTCTISKLNVV